jgi:hypothetical protein
MLFLYPPIFILQKNWTDIKLIDLFDNPVGYLTVLQFFRLKALQNCVF